MSSKRETKARVARFGQEILSDAFLSHQRQPELRSGATPQESGVVVCVATAAVGAEGAAGRRAIDAPAITATTAV